MADISKTMDSAFKAMDESFKTMNDTMGRLEKHFDDLSDTIQNKLNNEVDEIIKDARVVKVVKYNSSIWSKIFWLAIGILIGLVARYVFVNV